MLQFSSAYFATAHIENSQPKPKRDKLFVSPGKTIYFPLTLQ
jgi:hypothetical protein